MGGLDIAALYRRHGALVLNRCRLLLHNEADAQEACQLVFLNLHRHQASFRGECSPTTWLFKATTTTCLNQLRTRHRRREDIVEELPAIAAANDSTLDVLEVRELLDLLLEDEDEGTQAAVLYHFMDGMTHDEAGQLLGVTGAAVRKRIAGFRERAQKRAPRILKEVS
jgi:RNA polymerase sigma-70 factor (ECF subfamily)